MGSRLLNLGATATLFAVAAYAFRQRERLHIFCNGTAFLLLAWPALRIFNHLVMTITFPAADAQLAYWDQLIGFDWHAYLRFFDRHPMLLEMMAQTYTGLTVYTAFLFMVLLFSAKPQQSCAELLSLFVFTALICTTVGMTMPALGAMAHYAPVDGTFNNIRSSAGTYAVDAFFERRNGLPQIFDLDKLPGMTTFPSFHTAMGLIAIYCARRSTWLFVPMLTINVVMIAGTPIFGAHYLVDLLGGAAVVAFAILMLRTDWRALLRKSQFDRANQQMIAPTLSSPVDIYEQRMRPRL